MKLELRMRLQPDHVHYQRGCVFVAETQDESRLLDQVFGSKVKDATGLIFSGNPKVECRLSDGYATHYVAVEMVW